MSEEIPWLSGVARGNDCSYGLSNGNLGFCGKKSTRLAPSVFPRIMFVISSATAICSFAIRCSFLWESGKVVVRVIVAVGDKCVNKG